MQSTTDVTVSRDGNWSASCRMAHLRRGHSRSSIAIGVGNSPGCLLGTCATQGPPLICSLPLTEPSVSLRRGGRCSLGVAPAACMVAIVHSRNCQRALSDFLGADVYRHMEGDGGLERPTSFGTQKDRVPRPSSVLNSLPACGEMAVSFGKNRRKVCASC